MDHKRCKKCMTDFPVDQFYSKGKDRPRNLVCKWCCIVSYNLKKKDTDRMKNLRGQWNKASKKHAKKINRNHARRLEKYNLTQEQFEALVGDGSCNICGNSDDTMAIDHCHGTDIVRGYLCTTCNIGLGMFKDNSMLLRQAITYLTKI